MNTEENEIEIIPKDEQLELRSEEDLQSTEVLTTPRQDEIISSMDRKAKKEAVTREEFTKKAIELGFKQAGSHNISKIDKLSGIEMEVIYRYEINGDHVVIAEFPSKKAPNEKKRTDVKRNFSKIRDMAAAIGQCLQQAIQDKAVIDYNYQSWKDEKEEIGSLAAKLTKALGREFTPGGNLIQARDVNYNVNTKRLTINKVSSDTVIAIIKTLKRQNEKEEASDN